MAELPTFYSSEGLHTEIYDVFAARQVGHDLPFWVDCAREFGGPVLEAACGTGRVAWTIAAAGYEVVGVDLSEPMLARARAKQASHPDVAATFHQADMRDFELERRFRLVVVPFRAFQALLTVDDQMAALGCLRRHLVDGGHLVIDLFDPRLEFLIPGGRPDTAMTFDHPDRDTQVRIVTGDRQIDPVRQVFAETWQFTETDTDGGVLRTEAERITLRWIYRYEAMHLLHLAGFDIVAEYSDFDRSPPAYGHEQIWVARRP